MVIFKGQFDNSKVGVFNIYVKHIGVFWGFCLNRLQNYFLCTLIFIKNVPAKLLNKESGYQS